MESYSVKGNEWSHPQFFSSTQTLKGIVKVKDQRSKGRSKTHAQMEASRRQREQLSRGR